MQLNCLWWCSKCNYFICIDKLNWPAFWNQSLQAKQHCHERDLYELKIKTEREAIEAEAKAKLQMEENRHRVARVLHTLHVYHLDFVDSAFFPDLLNSKVWVFIFPSCVMSMRDFV